MLYVAVVKPEVDLILRGAVSTEAIRGAMRAYDKTSAFCGLFIFAILVLASFALANQSSFPLIV